MAGILTRTTWETSGSGGTWAAFGAMACAPSTSPSPSWKPEAASLKASCTAYPFLPLRKMHGGFLFLHKAQTQLMALMMNIKTQALLLLCILVCAGMKTPEGWPNPGITPQVLVYFLLLGLTRSLCRFLNPQGLLKRLKISKSFPIFSKYTQITLFTIPALPGCKIAVMWDTERVQRC